MKTIEDCFFEHAQDVPTASDEYIPAFARYFDVFSSIASECFYVLDIPQKQFCYIRPDDLFLCGFSVDDALKEGYDFYSRIVYQDDLLLWTNMRNIVLRDLTNPKEKQDEIDYFSCTLRLKRIYSFLTQHSLPQMIYHRMKPVWEDNELRYLICSIESSTIKETGNLCLHNKDGLTYEEYNFTTKHWKRKTKKMLTERERAILMLAGQGKSSLEIACHLFKGHNTIRNQIKELFLKLNVHSMQEAIEFACNYQLIYPKRNIGKK